MTESTIVALLDAAEDRFAVDGISSASLRAVMRQAGVDPGAVHYHFKGRESLAEAVLDRVLVPLNDRRLELLEHLGPSPTLPALVEALVRPDIDAATTLESRGAGRGRLMGAIYLEPERFVTELVQRRFVPVATAFQPHLAAALPQVPPDLLAWRVRWCVFGTLGAILADPDELGRRDPDELASLVVSTLVPALAGPPNPGRTP
ncbi:MAG: TetR/AcrR family transcriptional regulator [Actinomycetota bacterium]